MLYTLGVLAMILALLVSVALHELGHLIPAKLFGVTVPKYMVGFGPTLWSRSWRGTEYGIKAILLGGYISIAGMFWPGRPDTVIGKDAHGMAITLGQYRDLDDTARQTVRLSAAGELRWQCLREVSAGHRPFYALPGWKRIIIMAGGPVMNLLLALILTCSVLVGAGVPTPSTTLAEVVTCTTGAQTCAPDATTPAAAAGLQAGDQITAWNGKPTPTWAELRAAIQASADTPQQVTYLRAGVSNSVEVTPVRGPDGAYRVGIVAGYERQPVSFATATAAVWQMTKSTAGIVVQLPIKVWDTALALVGVKERGPDSVMSIVGAGRLAGDAISTSSPNGPDLGQRFLDLLLIIASLNIALFVFNLIPLTPLDGGHIIAVVYEAIRKRVSANTGPVDSAAMIGLTYGVVTFFLVMTAILVVADIVVPVRI